METLLLAILKIFPPEDYSKLRFLGDYWIILDQMLELELDKKEFCSDELTQQISQSKLAKDNSEVVNDVPQVLRKLKTNDLVTKNGRGYYEFYADAPNALREFFGRTMRFRKGRSGFVRYLSWSAKRIILWHCLSHGRSIELEEVSKLLARFLVCTSEECKERCNKYLDRFANKRWLARIETNRYKLADEQAIFKELFSGYLDFCTPKPTLRDSIRIAIGQHEFVSSRMACEDLREWEIPFAESSVYKQMKELEKEKVLAETGVIRKGKKGRGFEKFYAVKFGDPLKHNKEFIKEIKERLAKSGFEISEKFYAEAEKQKPNALEVFLIELRWGFLLRSEDQTASINLWLPFAKELYQEVFHGDLKTMFSSITSEGTLTERLESISREYGISPLATVMLYLASVNA
jgi:DNA-binding Lrp family transcriptional regulator